jgi:hypothetical protein
MLSYKTVLRAWDDFFFKPQPTEGIALFRIIWVMLIGFYFLIDLPNHDIFYGHQAVLSLKTVASQFNYPNLNVFLWMGDSAGFLQTVTWVYALALLFALVGFYTRTSLLVVLICLCSFHQRNIWLLSSSELLIRATTILLLCSPCGHSLSLDSYFARKEGRQLRREWAPWAVRVLQIQLSVVYLWTVWHKLKGDTWFDGTALYYATRNESMANFPVPILFDSIPFLRLATWGTLILEISLGTLIWIKELRKPLIITGIIFHLGIEYTMSIPFFELVMICILINFYTPLELKSFVISCQQRIRLMMERFKVKGRVRAGLLSLLGEEA